MRKSRKTACFCGVLAALCLTVPAAVQAEEIPVFSDRSGLQKDMDGNVWYQSGEEKQTGKFILEPDYLLGDITQDSAVDAADAAEILSAAAKAGSGNADAAQILMEIFPDYQEIQTVSQYVDINNDAEIDAGDAALILSYAAKSGTGEATHPLGYACYYADENGFLQSGWIHDSAEHTYFAGEDYTLLSGWISDDGKQYYLSKEDDTLLTGKQKIGSKKYVFDENGVFTEGWISDTDGVYYQTKNSGIVSGWQKLNGKYYYFNADGELQHEWLNLDDKTYYLNENGTPLTGWQKVDGQNYYFSPEGILQRGWLNLDNHTYYLDENGVLLTGWQEIGGQRYYLNEQTGERYVGWLDTATGKYYLNEEGIPVQGWNLIDEKKYYFDESGILQTGWLTLEENQYYLNPDDNGAMATGFVFADGNYYYMGSNGIMQKRKWLVVDGKTYYLGLKGDCLTGWQDLTGYIYYFQPDDGGAMSVGWTTVDDKLYYFDLDNGTLQKGWLMLGDAVYYLDDSGSPVTGWQTIDGSRYYFNVSGLRTTGWATINEVKYYFYEDGKLAVNTTIDGFYLGADGAASEGMLALNKQRARDALSQYGTSVSSIYSYMRSTNRYKYIESTKSLSQIEKKGWLYFVDYAFTHKYGVCYYMAAKMDFILQEAGYECRIVHATHSSGDHYWNQVYSNGSWLNYDCTNGYNAYSWSKIIAAGNYKFLGYVTPVYQ